VLVVLERAGVVGSWATRVGFLEERAVRFGSRRAPIGYPA
jgi:hypothetical protein